MSATKQDRPAKVRLRSFSKSLPASLLQAREAVMNRFRSTLRLFNITEQQWRVLRALSAEDAIEVTALAHTTCLLPPSLSRILKDMEERGLVEKTAVPEDLRRSLVSVTPAGLKLIDAVAPYSESIYAQISETFGEEKMEILQGLLKELVTELGTLSPIVHDENKLGNDILQLSSGQPRGRPRNN